MRLLKAHHPTKPRHRDSLMFASFLLLVLLLFLVLSSQPRGGGGGGRTQLSLNPAQEQLLSDLLQHMKNMEHDLNPAAAAADADDDRSEFFVEAHNRVVLSGYVRTTAGLCLYANANLTGLEVQFCTSPNLPTDKKRMLFQWTSLGQFTVMGRCITRYDEKVFLDFCYNNLAVQVWSQPSEEQFILSSEMGICFAILPFNGNLIRTVIAEDCWARCQNKGFSLVTWFVTKTMEEELDKKILDSLVEKETQPWQNRYCIDHRKIVLKNKNRDPNWKNIDKT